METLAMHISNGIIDGPVAAVFAAFALAAARALRAARPADLDDRLAPMAGLVAAFIFAVQMLNFPIFTAGVSGHLLGGALAAMLVGPWVGALCVAVVLIVQALVFGDGGVAMLGLNITNMALLGTAAAYLLIALLLRVLPRTAGRARPSTAFVAAVVSVVRRVAGLRRCSTGSAAPPTSATTWAAWPARWPASHLLIGIGEGLITATTVVTVAKVRPDLVYALRGLRPARRLPPSRSPEVPDEPASGGLRRSAACWSPCCSPAWSATSPRRTRTGWTRRCCEGCTVDADGQDHRRQLPGPAGRRSTSWPTPAGRLRDHGASTTRPVHRPRRA